MRVLGIADSDSYLKWLVALLDASPPEWEWDVVVVDGGAVPSDDQVRAALSDTSWRGKSPRVVSLRDVGPAIAEEMPQVVFLGARGPTVWRILERSVSRMDPRPVVATGLPGISIPATRLATVFRSGTDLFVVHSTREVREFEEICEGTGLAGRFALATLPFMAHPRSSETSRTRRDEIVFAAQAAVPPTEIDRRAILDALVDLARSQPRRKVVVKLRATADESQTHYEAFPYDTLLREYEAGAGSTGGLPANLVLSKESMASHLARAVGLVTVSSTAAIEALAAKVPALVLSDFGIRPALINTVFYGSGLFGTFDDLRAGVFKDASAEWREDNYFHDPGENTWIPALRDLVEKNARGQLPRSASIVRRELGWLQRMHAESSTFGRTDRRPRAVVVRALLPALRRIQRVVRAAVGGMGRTER